MSLISVGKLKYIKDDRFKIIHEDNNIEWVLAIRSLKKSDEVRAHHMFSRTLNFLFVIVFYEKKSLFNKSNSYIGIS